MRGFPDVSPKLGSINNSLCRRDFQFHITPTLRQIDQLEGALGEKLAAVRQKLKV
jgi:hypothetical protein